MVEEKMPKLAELDLSVDTLKVLDKYFTQQLVTMTRLGTLRDILDVSDDMAEEISVAVMRKTQGGEQDGSPVLEPQMQDLLTAVMRKAGNGIDPKFGKLTPVLNTLLLEAMQDLQPREKVLVRMKFGLGGKKCSISECAQSGVIRGNCNRLQTILDNALRSISQYMLPRFALMAFGEVDTLPLDYLGLEVPVARALALDGRFTTIGDLARTYDYVVRSVRNIGSKRITNIRQQLQVLGLEMPR